jgi:hypothetical protein
MMKLIAATLLVLTAFFGAYSRTPGQAKKPSPKVVFKNVKSRHKQMRAEVIDKIINRLLCESAEPVSDITVDFSPEILGPEEERGRKNEAKGELTISVTVNWEDGSSGVAWIEINKEGSLDNAYLSLMHNMPKKECEGRGKN